jgi:hypothetical protein
MIHHIINILKSDSDVTSYVDADNIFPLVRLQGSTIPAIVIQLVGVEPFETKDRQVDTDMYNVEITSMHENPKSAWLTCVAVRAALDDFAGNDDVYQIRMTNAVSDVFESTEVFTITQNYEVMMSERSISNP